MNIFSIPDHAQNKELSEILYKAKNLRIEKIVSWGQITKQGYWYDQKEDEFIILLQGEAAIEYENNQSVYLKAGDTLLIPAKKKHRVTYTSKHPPCIWICVFDLS